MIYGGMRILTSTHEPFVKQVGEDWSCVRSPGRAARRRRQGHRQNIHPVYEPTGEIVRMGDTLVMHPATADQLSREIMAKPAPLNERKSELAFMGLWP